MLDIVNSNGYVEPIRIESEKVTQSQREFLYFKRVSTWDHINLMRLFNEKYPQISAHKKKTDFCNKFIILFSPINSSLGLKFGHLFEHTPLKLHIMCTKTFNLMNSSSIKGTFDNLSSSNKGWNILILHAHWNNRGDEAAIRAMIESLELKLPIKNMRIMFISKNPLIFPYKDIEILKLYPTLEKKITSILSFMVDICFTLITFGKWTFTKQGKIFLKAVDDADVVIHAPAGPSIGNIYRDKSGISEMLYLYRLLISTIKGKSTFLYAPSIGPFTGGFSNFIRKIVLKKISCIIVREEISSKYLKDQLGLDSYVTIDSSLQNEIPEDYIKKYSAIPDFSQILDIIETEKVVGMALTDLSWHPLYKNNMDLKKRIKRSLLKTTEYIISKGYTILLIPHLFGEQDDLSFLEYIGKSNKDRIKILPSDLDSYVQQIVISKLFCVIGMRYHPNIFALKACVPFISIAYEHKMEGFTQKSGLTNLMIHINEIDPDIIIDKFKYLENNYDGIKCHLEKKSPQLKNISKKTTKIIKKIMQEKSK